MYEEVRNKFEPMIDKLTDLVCDYIEANKSEEHYVEPICPVCGCEEYVEGIHRDYFGLDNKFVTERICNHCGCIYIMIYKLAEVSKGETK